jgi:hypothetical protein
MNAGAQFHGGFHNLWPLAGLMVSEKNGQDLPETHAFLMDHLVQDFTNNPPELVWVDENEGLESIAGQAVTKGESDILAFLFRDARFAKIWANYDKIGEIVDTPKNTGETMSKDAKKPARMTYYARKKS